MALKNSSLTRDASFVFFSALITQGSILVLYIFLARVLSIEEFATFRQLFLLQAILSGTFFGAFPTCLLYFSGRANNEDEKKRYLQVVVYLTTLIAFLLSILIFAASDFISTLLNNEKLREVLPYFSLSPLGILMIALMPSCHVALNKVSIQPYLAVLIAIFVVIPSSVIAFNGATLVEIVRLISITYFMVGVGLVALMILIFGAVRNVTSDIFSNGKQVLVYAWPLLAASAISILGLKADHLIIASLLGTIAYGLYSIGAFEIPVFNILQNSVASVLMPKITSLIKENLFKDASDIWRIAAFRTASITFPIALIFMVNAQEIITLLFGYKYKDAYVVFILFNSLAFVRVITFGLALRALNKNHIELAITFIYLFLSMLGSYFIAPIFGINGVALWVLLNTVLLSILISIFTYRITNGKLALCNIYPIKHMVVSLILFLLIHLIEGELEKIFKVSWVVTSINIAVIAITWTCFIRVLRIEKIT